MKKICIITVLFFFVISLTSCKKNLENSPFDNNKQNGIEDLLAYEDNILLYINTYYERFSEYDEFERALVSPMDYFYQRLEEDKQNLLSNKYFFDWRDSYSQISFVRWKINEIMTSLDLSDNNDDKIKEGNIYDYKSYYLEEYQLFLIENTLSHGNGEIIEIYINISQEEPMIDYRSSEYQNGIVKEHKRILIDFLNHTQIQVEVSDKQVRYTEFMSDNSFLTLKLMDGYSGTSTHEYGYDLIYYNASENESYKYRDYIDGSEDIYYTKYIENHLLYSFYLSDTSIVRYNMHYLDGWNKIDSYTQKHEADVYLDDLLLLSNATIYRYYGKQFYLDMTFDQNQLTNEQLSLETYGLHSSLTVELIDEIKGFSFDSILAERDLSMDFDQVRDQLLNDYILNNSL